VEEKERAGLLFMIVLTCRERLIDGGHFDIIFLAFNLQLAEFCCELSLFSVFGASTGCKRTGQANTLVFSLLEPSSLDSNWSICFLHQAQIFAKMHPRSTLQIIPQPPAS